MIEITADDENFDLLTEMAALAEKKTDLEPYYVDHVPERLPAVMDYAEKLAIAKRGLALFQAEADALRSAVFALTIKDQAGSAVASEHKAVAQKITKRIDAKVKEITQEATDYVAAVRNFAANLKAPLSEAKTEADHKISVWAQYVRIEREKQERAAREALAKEQAKIDKSAERKGIEPVILPEPKLPPQRTKITTDSGTTFETRKWKFEIIDPDKVDRKYCSPDPVKIREAVAGGARNPDLAGIDVFEHTQMVTRTV